MSQLKEQNGKYYQQCQVVMLATDKAIKGSTLIKFERSGRLEKSGYSQEELDKGEGIKLVYQPQHLYMLSDEKIKEGDYIYTEIPLPGKPESSVSRCTNIKTFNPEGWKKIIATTDESLGLPKPSDSFINKHIEEYNKGNQITNVLVEYENKWNGKEYVDEQDAYGYDKFKLQLKVDSDNTVTIKKLKDSYSREEVLKILSDVMNLGMSHRQDQLEGHTVRSGNEVLEEWIKQKL